MPNFPMNYWVLGQPLCSGWLYSKSCNKKKEKKHRRVSGKWEDVQVIRSSTSYMKPQLAVFLRASLVKSTPQSSTSSFDWHHRGSQMWDFPRMAPTIITPLQHRRHSQTPRRIKRQETEVQTQSTGHTKYSC